MKRTVASLVHATSQAGTSLVADIDHPVQHREPGHRHHEQGDHCGRQVAHAELTHKNRKQGDAGTRSRLLIMRIGRTAYSQPTPAPISEDEGVRQDEVPQDRALVGRDRGGQVVHAE